MTKRSKNPYDVFKWLEKVGDSIVTVEQSISFMDLVLNFEKQYSIRKDNKELAYKTYELFMKVGIKNYGTCDNNTIRCSINSNN